MKLYKLKSIFKSKRYLKSIFRIVEYPLVLRLLNPTSEDTILDLGCGYGELSKILSKYAKFVVGVGISSEAILNAKSISKYVDFIIADGTKLPFKSEVFDKVVCNCVLEHVVNEDSFLSEVNRILKPKGLAIFTLDSFSHPKIDERVKKDRMKNSNVVRYYTINIASKIFEAHGFKILDYRYYLCSNIAAIYYNKMSSLAKYKVIYHIFALIMYLLIIIAEKLVNRSNYKNFGLGLAIKVEKIS